MDQNMNINDYFAQSIRDNWDRLALTDFDGQSLQYRAVARKIAKLHILFEEIGLRPGEKIAICGRNSSHWSVAFISAMTYGAVAVPILPDFKPDNIHHLVCHCGARLLFVDPAIWENLDPEAMGRLGGAFAINDFSLLHCRDTRLNETRHNLNRLFGARYPERFTPDDIAYYTPSSPDDLALINYTSGSTGFSKGVMLSYRNIWSNIRFTLDQMTYLRPGDKVVAMLPHAHMFGLIFELINSFAAGCHLFFLTRVPSPRIIMDAFAKVHPRVVVTVPLIIEKIIRTRIFPLLDKPLMKLMLNVPFVDDRLLGRIKDRLTETFGGDIQEVIIGGAALNREVERFLRRIHFPFTVGYGMTECCPLISFAPWSIQRPGSCGRIVDRMEARIDSNDPANIPGLLLVRGQNLMKGYYNNPEATEAVMRDGWLNTGDICQIDEDGFLYIRGRDKNLILGPSGQNIYPEEIEEKLNVLPYVNESLIVDKDNKLVALIYPDFDNARREGLDTSDIEGLMRQNIQRLNDELPAYSRVSDFRIYQEEFEKTPKRSIKRYLYKI